jgi:hypothetical protein
MASCTFAAPRIGFEEKPNLMDKFLANPKLFAVTPKP